MQILQSLRRLALKTPRKAAMALAFVVLSFFGAPHITLASEAYATAAAEANRAVAAAATADAAVRAAFGREGSERTPITVTAATAQQTAAAALANAATLAAQDAQTAARSGDSAAAATAQAVIPQLVDAIKDAQRKVQEYRSWVYTPEGRTSVLNSLAQVDRALATANTALSDAATAAGDTATATRAAAAATTASTAATSAAADATPPSANECNILTNFPACIHNLIFAIIKWIALFFLFLASFFLGLVGLLLNWTIYITVFQFGNLIGNNPGMLAAWGVLRDIGNILLLFGFIFMGVSTILNLPGSEYTAKRALPTLIIFAILLNFSLFAAEAIIDTSNALGSTFYRQAGNGLCPSNNLLGCATNYGISGAVLQISGISSIFSISDQFPEDNAGSAIGIIGLTIFASTVAMVLLAAVFMLIARATTLAFLMVVSPIGFAGMAVPPLHRFAKMWWDQLLKQSFFAPIYILLVLISIKFMDGMRTAIGGGTDTLATAFSSGGVSNLSMVVMFILMIGFLLAATEAAKGMGAIGAGSATKWAGAVVYGGMARAANASIGGAARGTRAIIQRTPLRSMPGSRFVTNTVLRPLEGANLDIRRLPGMGAVQKVAGGPAEHASYNDLQHQKHEVRAKLDAGNAQYAKEVAKSQFMNDAHKGQLSPESERYLAGLSAEEIAADHALQHSIVGLADQLSSEQFEGLMKSEKVTASEKTKLAQARFAEPKRIAEKAMRVRAENEANGTNNPEFDDADAAAIKRMSDKDLEMMAKYAGDDFNKLVGARSANGGTLTSNSQNDALEKSRGLTRSQQGAVRQNTRRERTAELAQQVSQLRANPGSNPNTTYAAEFTKLEAHMRSLTPKEKVKMDNSIFLDRDAAELLTSDDLREFMREAKFTNPADRARISSIVRAKGNQDIVKYFNDPRAQEYWL